MGSGSSFSSFPSVGKISSSLLERFSSSSSVPQPSGFPQGPKFGVSLSSVPLSLTSAFFFSSFPFFLFSFFCFGESATSEPKVLAISVAKLFISCAVSGLSLTNSSVICLRLAMIAFISSLVLSFFFNLGLLKALGSSFCSLAWNRLFRLSSLSNCSPSSNSGFFKTCSFLGAKNLFFMSFIFGSIWISSLRGVDFGIDSSFSCIFFLISASLGTYSRLSSAIVGFSGSSFVEVSKFFLISDTPWLNM